MWGAAPPSPAAERSERIFAVVVSDATETELKQFLLPLLPAWQFPREWRFVDAIPAGPRGKISRVKWREFFCPQPLASPS